MTSSRPRRMFLLGAAPVVGMATTGWIFRNELIRWALSLPGCLPSRAIGKMYGRSHFWMRTRAKEIQRAVNSDAIGMFPHVNAKRDKFKQAKKPTKSHDVPR